MEKEVGLPAKMPLQQMTRKQIISITGLSYYKINQILTETHIVNPQRMLTPRQVRLFFDYYDPVLFEKVFI
jgi:hypothetical protein